MSPKDEIEIDLKNLPRAVELHKDDLDNREIVVKVYYRKSRLSNKNSMAKKVIRVYQIGCNLVERGGHPIALTHLLEFYTLREAKILSLPEFYCKVIVAAASGAKTEFGVVSFLAAQGYTVAIEDVVSTIQHLQRLKLLSKEVIACGN
jgi:hypothetical protein